MKRRNFLKLGTAGALGAASSGLGLITWATRAEAATVEYRLYITDGTIQQADGVSVYFRGYSSSSNSLNVPGEQMVAQEGDTLRVIITNTLNTSHNFVIDGVVNSGRIAPGQTRTVQFTVNEAGSYMYHDNYNGERNRLVGMHGGLAVMPAGRDDQLYAGSPRFVQQYFWIFHDIDPAWNNAIRNGSNPSGNYVPRYFTINGLYGIPPGAAGNGGPLDAMHDHRTALHGRVGDRTLVRIMNAGKAAQSVHTHANHMEWLTENGNIRPDVWEKDILYLEGNMGRLDVIFPFDSPPDAWPRTNTGVYPMHLHSEMSQTSGGGLYMFGALTDIFFE